MLTAAYCDHFALFRGETVESACTLIGLTRCRLIRCITASTARSTGQSIARPAAAKPSPTSHSEPENPPPSVENVTAAIARIVRTLPPNKDSRAITIGLGTVIGFSVLLVAALSVKVEWSISLQSAAHPTLGNGWANHRVLSPENRCSPQNLGQHRIVSGVKSIRC